MSYIRTCVHTAFTDFFVSSLDLEAAQIVATCTEGANTLRKVRGNNEKMATVPRFCLCLQIARLTQY